MSRLFFKRRPSEGHGPSPDAVPVPPSKVVEGLLRYAERLAESGGTCRVLLCGPPSGPTIETFSGRGCRVTVEGDAVPVVPLEHADGTFDLLLVFDQLDFIDDEKASALAAEWARVLKSGGRVYLLSRQKSKGDRPRLRVDVLGDGRLGLKPLRSAGGGPHLRSNREIETALAPLRVDEILLRRDGLREISGRAR